mmetsp:Transcript_24231/g.72707  ORF Transcript_24231/g.72707 Transcript_24231/m.72707 type:complete len:562 (-) Transcript_24231:25-1710(-)
MKMRASKFYVFLWLIRAESGWVDPDTPRRYRSTRPLNPSSMQTDYELVFSDEFEVDGRTFKDGHDPRWTATDKNDYTNMALHFYKADKVTTTGGTLNITTAYEPTSFMSAEDKKGYVEMQKRRKPYASGHVQGWGKFCFTGGVMEIRARLPGAGKVGGLWPAMWLLGALSRATYVGSTDWVWPWSFDKCDRTLQPKQEINACEPNPHYGLEAFTGRGAPEIDLLEAMPGSGTLGYGLTKPYFSASYQVAPGKPHDRPVEGKKPREGQWYEKGLVYGDNATVNAFFYGEELSHKTARATYVADAVSANRPLDASHFDDFHDYRLEWATAEGEESLTWFLDGELVFHMPPEALELTGAKMPDEPMHILLNTAVSSTWGFPAPCPPGCPCDCYDCIGDLPDPACACGMPEGLCAMLPAFFEIDSVRVYQAPADASQKVGCSTDTRPTKKFIEGHRHRYFDVYNGETQPLRPLLIGGGNCTSNAGCGPASHCRNRACVCADGWTGPHCKAHAAYDDHNWDKESKMGFHAPIVPPALRRAIALLATGLCAVLARHVVDRRKQRATR